MIAAALALALALGGPLELDGLSESARDFYARGQQYERDGQWSKAAAAYRVVWSQTPGWSRALVDQARVLVEAGRTEDALRVLDDAPWDADALEAKGRLLLAEERSEEAAEAFHLLVTVRPEWPGARLLLAEALVDHDLAASDVALRRYLDEADPVDEEAVGRVALALVHALLADEQEDAAWSLASLVQEQLSDDAPLGEIDHILMERDVDEHAKRLEKAAALPLSPLGVTRLREARQLLFAGEVSAARTALGALTELEPRASAAWSARSVAEERAGDIGAAVASAQQAEALDPLDADASVRVGDLLARYYGGRLDTRAIDAYDQALLRRGSDAQLWWRKAEAERRKGRISASEASYRRVVDLAPGTELARKAEEILDQLARPIPPEVPRVEGEEFRPSAVPEEAWHALHRAWVWQLRAAGDEAALARAREEIALALSLAPTWTKAINLDAAIRLDEGDGAGALERYRRSLELDPDQGAVWLVVGALLRQQGDVVGADAAVQQAAELGEPEALLARAEEANRRWRLWEAWELLQRYQDRSVEAQERVGELRRQVRVRASGLAGAAVAGLFGLVAPPLLWWRRRRSGVGLDAVLARDARAFPEVARILAAIRHEVIKHHTTVLDAVADALEDGDDGPATWAEERLFGAEGAVPTFFHYLDELRGLAERQGLRLNLRHADPELAPVVAAMDALKSIEGRIARQEPQRLRTLARALNGEGYRALGRRVRALCQQTVDDTFVREAWALACRELGQVPPFEVEVDDGDGPLVVRMFRQDLLDVLVNLLRNAVQANEATGGGRVGVFVEVEDDWVTGLERVVVQVRDDSTLRLDTERLRGRFLGRGLGLAVDRVTQAGGSIHVEEAAGWAKAVTVRLPRLEVDGDDDAIDGPGEPGFGGEDV